MNSNTPPDRAIEMLHHDDAPCGDIRQYEAVAVATVNRKKRQIPILRAFASAQRAA